MGDVNWDEVILLDRDRSAPLWDVGAPGYLAAVGVDPDGDDVLALVSEEHLGVEGALQGCADQPHEQTGRLPALWRRRIKGDPRCGQLTSRGRSCRAKVANHGDICGVHRRTPVCGACGELMFHDIDGWGCYGCHPHGGWTLQAQDADTGGAP